MIVVDASVVLPALRYDGPAGDHARSRLREVVAIAPHLLDVEVMSGLRGNVRQGLLAAERAALALDGLVRSEIGRVSHGRLLTRAWELRDNLSAYDAVYVALAELVEATLLTADASLAGAPGIRCHVEVLATPA